MSETGGEKPAQLSAIEVARQKWNLSSDETGEPMSAEQRAHVLLQAKFLGKFPNIDDQVIDQLVREYNTPEYSNRWLLTFFTPEKLEDMDDVTRARNIAFALILFNRGELDLRK